MKAIDAEALREKIKELLECKQYFQEHCHSLEGQGYIRALQTVLTLLDCFTIPDAVVLTREQLRHICNAEFITSTGLPCPCENCTTDCPFAGGNKEVEEE